MYWNPLSYTKSNITSNNNNPYKYLKYRRKTKLLWLSSSRRNITSIRIRYINILKIEERFHFKTSILIISILIMSQSEKKKKIKKILAFTSLYKPDKEEEIEFMVKQ